MVLAALIAAYHAVKSVTLAVNLRDFPALGTEPGRGRAAPAAGEPGIGGEPRPRVSILIPARDEARRLPSTLPGFLAQPADEILILDDGSTDATADIVRSVADDRVRLISGTERPDGWIGKNWACHQLAEKSSGDLLVFCDADVTLRPGALAAVLADMRRQRAEVFSVFPRQQAVTLGERFLVPLIDETLLGFLPHRLLAMPIPAAATANGQLIAFRRDAYAAIGGHLAVSDRIVEDVALGRLARRRGHRLGLSLGGDLVSTRMYDGYLPAVRGLGKSLRAAHGGSDALLLASAAGHVAAYTLPWLMWNHGTVWQVAAMLGLAERVLTNIKTGRGALWEALLVPVTPIAALPVYAVALRRTAHWKGRRYA